MIVAGLCAVVLGYVLAKCEVRANGVVLFELGDPTVQLAGWLIMLAGFYTLGAGTARLF